MIGRSLQRLRSAFTRRSRGPSVELRPIEQVAMLFFHRFGRATADQLYMELNTRLGASHTDTGECIVRLLSAGLIEARYLGEEGKTDVSYVATRLGSRLEGRIPTEPRTVTEFWL